jgi:cystathionine beta-synthase
MKYAQSILDLIGNTPLIRLNHVTDGIKATVLVKLEYLNPGGSIKDRIAAKMIEEAERDGKLRPGGTIVEPTSGNTGVGLALVAQQKGYKCIFVVPDKVGEDKRAVLQAYGAEVVVTPTSVAPDSPQSYYSVSDRIVSETPGAYKPDQFSNPAAPGSHYESTGPEIWRDTDGKVTHHHGDRPVPEGNLCRPSGVRRRPRPDCRGRPRGLGVLRRHRTPVLRGGRGRRHVAGELRQIRTGRGHRRQ